MAVAASVRYWDGLVTVELYPGQPHNWIADDPDDREWPMPVYFFWDLDKLDRGEREFAGIDVLDVSDITDDLLNAMDTLDLPRIDVPEADLYDASISDVLRWAREHYPSRYSGTVRSSTE